MNHFFAFVIQRGGGFIEYEDARVGQEGAGDRDSLALAAGERGALFADFGIVAWNSSGGGCKTSMW